MNKVFTLKNVFQTMLEDKIKATDWEATNEAIEEQVARESYLQWLRDNEMRKAVSMMPSGDRDCTALINGNLLVSVSFSFVFLFSFFFLFLFLQIERSIDPSPPRLISLTVLFKRSASSSSTSTVTSAQHSHFHNHGVRGQTRGLTSSPTTTQPSQDSVRNSPKVN